jgi:hypothetical protein
LGAKIHAAGDAFRAVLPETKQDAAIDSIRRTGASLISITPVRATLEDYFLEKLQETPQEVQR